MGYPNLSTHTAARTAVFWTDASPVIGGGHVMRCLALADMLTKCGWRCIFACREGSAESVPALARSGVVIVNIAAQAADVPDTLKAIIPEGCEFLVVDHYLRDADHERACRPWAKRIVVLDDLADRPHDSDLLLDQTLGRRTEDYRSLVPAQCKLLLGPNVALLRGAFAVKRNRSLSRARGSVRRVLISPGQTDRANFVGLALAAAQKALPEAAIDVVLGVATPSTEALIKQTAGDVELHLGIDAQEFADLMVSADLAIGAGGGSAWERCTLGLPTVVVIVADNQTEVAAALEHAGAAHVAGRIDDLDARSLANVIEKLCDSPDALTNMSRKAAEICDGRGTFRVVAALTPAVRGVDGALTELRAAEKSDADLMYTWQSEPETRKYSRNADIPSFDEHIAWLDQKLADDKCLFTMVERNGVPSALLRLDSRQHGYEVSIVVAPNLRNKGIGAIALQLGRALVPGHILTAHVKPENTASVRLFERAGYRRAADGMYQQMPLAA